MELLRSKVSRADLIRAVANFPQTPVDEFSSLFGFLRKQEESTEAQSQSEPLATGAFPPLKDDSPSDLPTTTELEPPRYWRMVSYKALDEQTVRSNKPDWFYSAKSYANDRQSYAAAAGATAPTREPLTPWSQLWPFLRLVLGVMNQQKIVDLDKATERLSRCKPLNKLPYRQKHGWSNTCQIIVDCDNRLIPLWDDMTSLCQQVRKLRGRYGCSVLMFDDGPLGKCREVDNIQNQSREYSLPAPQTPILVLSDLGLLDPSEQRRKGWVQFGRTLRQAGFAPVVLTLSPSRLWDEEIARYWTMFCWDRGELLPRVAGSHKRDLEFSDEKDYSRGADGLLNLLAPCIRVEPALLRAARFLLPKDQADVAAEVAVWRHRDVRSECLGFAYENSAVSTYRKQFASKIDPELQTSLLDLIERYHCTLSPLILDEERFNVGTLAGNNHLIAIAEQSLQRYLMTLDQEKPHVRDLVDSFKAWFGRRSQRIEEGQWQKSEVLQAAYVKTHLADILNHEEVDLHGITVTNFSWLYERTDEPKLWNMAMDGQNELLFSPVFGDDGITVGVIGSCIPVLDVKKTSYGVSKPAVVHARENEQFGLSLQKDEQVTFSSDVAQVVLDSITKPSWATGIGREQEGLYVTLPYKRKLYWFNPGRHPELVKNQLLSIDHADGFWLNETHYKCLGKMFDDDNDWADEIDIDEYGVYAEFSVGKVKQRLRWIWPGEFKMGSPEDEPERIDDEQHDVVLSAGFWLADTACTQELWQEIMGKNPAKFKGKNLPVENVSWEDCQRFLQAIKERKLGLDLRLPTEAEWEFACRAEKSTPFSFGENITPEQVNYHGEHPYNNGEKGEFRRKTVAVKSLRGNDWGLYEMHGNVCEWCGDWFCEYSSEPVVDPVGPSGGSSRVLRGGSWLSDAGRCRSASRHRDDPGSRLAYIGFRFARGQKK